MGKTTPLRRPQTSRLLHPLTQGQQLARGIEYIYSLTNETCYETKLALSKSQLGVDSTQLFDKLSTEEDADVDDYDGDLRDYSPEQIAALAPCQDPQDTDSGPYDAWRVTHLQVNRFAFVMFGNSQTCREHAYVFWDSARQQEHELLTLFDNLPQGERHEYTNEEHEAMRRSWDERSEVYQKGGRGYWSEGDLSHVVWCGMRR